MGDGVFQVRFGMALLAIATIPLTCLAARAMFDSRRVALLSALLLAVMQWHLIYSRIAFLVVSWPLVEMLVVLCLFLALKRRNQLWFAAAGLALGTGVYTYNVYPVFVGAVLLFTVLQIIQARSSRRGRLAIGFGIMAVCTVTAALPLLRYAVDKKNDYTAHHRIYGLQGELEWQTADGVARIRILIDKTRDYVKLVTWGEHPDSVDATGRRPMLDWLALVLVSGGIYWCLIHILLPQSQLLLTMLLVLPLGSILSIEAGIRRTLGLAPFLVMMMALSIDWLWTMGLENPGVCARRCSWPARSPSPCSHIQRQLVLPGLRARRHGRALGLGAGDRRGVRVRQCSAWTPVRLFLLRTLELQLRDAALPRRQRAWGGPLDRVRALRPQLRSLARLSRAAAAAVPGGGRSVEDAVPGHRAGHCQ